MDTQKMESARKAESIQAVESKLPMPNDNQASKPATKRAPNWPDRRVKTRTNWPDQFSSQEWKDYICQSKCLIGYSQEKF